MSVDLGLNADDAHELAVGWWNNVLAAKQDWVAAAHSDTRGIAERSARLAGTQLDELRAFGRSSSRGIVLCSIHMGNYLGALAAIIGALPGRRIVVVRRRLPGQVDSAVFAKLGALGIESEVILTADPHAALKLARHLKGGCVAILFYDLPAGFGRPAPVTFLRRTVWWVEGPVRIAAICNARILPFFVFREPVTDTDCLELYPVVDFERPHPPASERRAVLQWLATIAGNQVRRFPEQWLHWSMLPAMCGGRVLGVPGE
jgi:lauroyl/myristoyl acyltransferase